MKLPRVNFPKLTNEQLRTVITRILAGLIGRDNTPSTVALLIVKLEKLLATLDKILLRERSSEITKQINELDENRDRAYRYLLRKIRFALDEFDVALVEAAESLLPVTDEFGVEIVELANAEETARLSLVIQTLRTPQNLGALTTLGAVADLDRVESFNSEFELAQQKRTTLESDKEPLPSLRLTKNEIASSLRLLIKVVEFLYNENEGSINKEQFDLFNTELTEASALIKLRATRAESGDTE